MGSLRFFDLGEILGSLPLREAAREEARISDLSLSLRKVLSIFQRESLPFSLCSLW
jgi:hypothetical protein